jgi:hypothetical protein
MEYSGPERRKKDTAYDGPPKRKGEQCDMCQFIWRKHDEEKVMARTHICKKIESCAKEIDELQGAYTPRWVFTLIIAGTFAFSLLLFGWTATTIKDGQDSVKESLKVLHERISKNDAEVSADTKQLKGTLDSLNYFVQSIDSRLKTVEKYVEVKK